MDWIHNLEKDILDEFNNKAGSFRTEQYANWKLTQIRPKLQRVKRETAYEDFLLRHLESEREKFRLYRQDGEREEILDGTPYDELREEPVCTCNGKRSHQCPLKRGILPREVREAGDLDEGIRQFAANHDGNPVVLYDAQDAFESLVGAVEKELRELLSVLTLDTIPPNTGWPDAQNQEMQPAD